MVKVIYVINVRIKGEKGIYFKLWVLYIKVAGEPLFLFVYECKYAILEKKRKNRSVYNGKI